MSEREIFIAALDRPAGDARQAFLEAACADDRELRSHVDALIEAHENAGKFLRPSGGVFAKTVLEPRIVEGPGSVVGPYRLLEQIGEGGFGIVFMAEQSEPVRRKVALKVIKPGMDSRQVIARFEAERQALALMDHPNIAKVFDAGTTESGRPYFVMELVRGIPITDYSDQHSLTVPERLDLFVDVCHAAQHAHQKGIIHRDIKPSNVLVTLHDDKPVVKVIDFGVAKATSGQLTDKTLFTGFMQMLGTPLYMSPEQTALSGVDVDTRSDIYSLGVLLYELLTGTTPFDRKLLEKATFDEIRRIIREEEPKKPSTRVSTFGNTLSDLCLHRKTDPHKFSQTLKGDLDWIVMKALEKDRTRRYETANGFARDIQRYLKDEVVEARPPSAGYRMRKFGRRNKVALATAGMVSLSLVLGTAASVSQMLRARSAEEAKDALWIQEKQARHEAENNLKQARDVVDVYFTQVSQSKLFNYPGLQELRKDLLQSAVQYYETHLKEHGDNPSVLADLASTHIRVAVTYHEIGQNDVTVTHLESAAEIVDRLFREFPESKDARLRLAGFWKGRRTVALTGGMPLDYKRAASVALRLISLWEMLAAEHPGNLSIESDLALIKLYLSVIQSDTGVATNDPSVKRDGVETGRQAIAIWDKLVAARPDSTEFLEHLTMALETHAHYSKVAGMNDEAVAAELKAEQLAQQLAAKHPEIPQYRMFVIDALGSQAQRLEESGKRTEAMEIHTRRLALANALMGEFPTVAAYQELAASIMSRMLVNSPVLGGSDGPRTRSDLGGVALFSKRDSRAPTLQDETIAGRLNGTAWSLVASPVKESWQPDRAVALARMSVGLVPHYGQAWNTLGVARYRAGDWKGAEAALRRSMVLQAEAAGYDWLFLAMSLWQQGDKEQARKWFDAACLWTDEYAPSNSELVRFRAEATELFGLPATPAGQDRPDDLSIADAVVELSPTAPTRRMRAVALARREQWQEAAAEFQFVLHVDELAWYTYYERALTLLAAHQVDEYRQVCAEMARLFGNSYNKDALSFVAWTAALAPQSTLDYSVLVALVDESVKLNNGNGNSLKDQGAIYFRSGRYHEAIDRLTESVRLLNESGTSDANWDSIVVYPQLFLAMSYHQLKRPDEARKWLDRARSDIQKARSEHENGKLKMSWNRRATITLLEQEAETLFGRSSQTAKTN